ncbi:GIY-YIG nuclease family protein [Athalassotoga saccharophila]|uniref:GIY-YIG nuclease family protein n=1 Tax=Athalassotoga saccharophila TaxID=1441386 RepID=UPI001379F6EA|nr:GIY-YIG nuclease family protein [Athalassotoga saccharophila]BBJ27462.1 hypothetical protein ATHSA_0331 [Athalassotoga saccharophila]
MKNKGVYILFINLKKPQKIKVGKLGEMSFESGHYIYVGSAQNSLKSRLERHRSRSKKLFWHVDYFLDNPESEIEKIFVKEAPKSMECEMARFISKIADGIPKFGSSDCKCDSHFFTGKVDDLLKVVDEFGLIEYDR